MQSSLRKKGMKLPNFDLSPKIIPVSEKPCSYFGRKLEEPCNACCANKNEKVTTPGGKQLRWPLSERKLTREDVAFAKALGLNLTEEDRLCAHSKGGKCAEFHDANEMVKFLCKGFNCKAARNFKIVMGSEYAEKFMSEIKSEPDVFKRLKILENYFGRAMQPLKQG